MQFFFFGELGMVRPLEPGQCDLQVLSFIIFLFLPFLQNCGFISHVEISAMFGETWSLLPRQSLH